MQQDITNLLEGMGAEQSSSTVDLSMLLEAIRQFLNMDVAFTSRFAQGQRKVELVSANDEVSFSRPLTSGLTVPLEQSYCFSIVSGELTNIIADTAGNEITCSMSLTHEMEIGAFIGVPITLQNGDTYGTLCCYDQAPNPTLNHRDVELLHIIASYAGQVLGRNLATQQHKDELRSTVREVIDNNRIEVVFQPIYGKQSNSYEYYEVLARFNTQPYRPPNEWLEDADFVGLGLEVESAIIKQVVTRLQLAGDQDLDLKASINVSPRMVESGLLPGLLTEVSSDQVRIELTEHVGVTNYETFRSYLKPLVQRGFKICIDDVGAGFASLKHILEIEPDVIKLDLSLASNIHLDPKRQALVTGLLAFARSFNCEVVAEGVETAQEFQALKALGVTFFQGWFFSRPVKFEQLDSNLAVAAVV
ncbi:EAL domain-containing protein [Salinimonas marina]|uniref:EAL domain-containing protein n=1 Tax=Salinimonas marina TaxID=2785918 RepID=A0A7S9HD31_9ALTE|nr:EAL domain-containing protein [Salinimonas marina]QPG05497.1 EAL domain-containing protein [Salinimonas marina]